MEQPPGKRRQANIRPHSQLQQDPSDLKFVKPNSLGKTTHSFQGTTTTPSPTQGEQKVPIPRLQHSGQKPYVASSDRQRVSHACEPCRRRKSKCDGLRPVCSRCRDQEINCFYADGKREKLKRNARTMTAKIVVYENLLTQILPNQNIDIQQAIRNALSENFSFSEEDHAAPGDITPSGDEANDDEHSVPATVTSPRFHDRAQRNASGYYRSTSFLGKASSICWMEEVLVELTLASCEPDVQKTSSTQRELLHEVDKMPKVNVFDQQLLQECTYFAKGLDFTQFAELSQSIDALVLPPRSTANLLMTAYFTTIHPTFPVLQEAVFKSQFYAYFENREPPNGSLLWVAILNVVFALGSLYSHYIHTLGDGQENHAIYWVRSRTLGQEPIHTLNTPTMEHIQFTAISGMYLTASYQINRAWPSIALGVRYAYARALHLVNAAPNISDETREFEVRVWHSICSIEQFLCILTGLPSAIQDHFISSRLPRTSEAYFTASSSFGSSRPQSATPSIRPVKGLPGAPWSTFVAGLRLDTITSEALVALYSSRTVNYTWASVQRFVSDLDRKLNQWREDLPSGALKSSRSDDLNTLPISECIYLSMRFYGASMLINRPSLCDPQEVGSAIPAQSESSRRMDADAAMRCISSARNLIQLLPENINCIEFYRSTPWWCALHYVIQAGTIMCMEMSFDTGHIPLDEVDDLINESILVLRWLYTLASTSDSAHRAWLCFSRILRLALGKTGKSPTNILLYMPNMSIILS